MALRESSESRVEEFGSAWETLFRAVRRARLRAPEGKAAGGLTLSQYVLLEPLADGAPRSVGELAAAAGVKPPTATRTLDALERCGVVARRVSERDRRSLDVTITPLGELALSSARKWVQAGRRQIYDALSPDEREAALKLLPRLAEVVDELVERDAG